MATIRTLLKHAEDEIQEGINEVRALKKYIPAQSGNFRAEVHMDNAMVLLREAEVAVRSNTISTQRRAKHVKKPSKT